MKKKVLVVDDNFKNLMLEKDLLELAGYEIFEAENAYDGIAIARAEKLDLIVMDLQLPDMRGSEAAIILRQEDYTKNTPIIFVTASVIPEVREELRHISNSNFIGKPINTRTFANEISDFMKHS